jgi:hypothetical protein
MRGRCLRWVKLGPRPTSELGPFILQQRTFGEYRGMSEKCQTQTSRLFSEARNLDSFGIVRGALS